MLGKKWGKFCARFARCHQGKKVFRSRVFDTLSDAKKWLKIQNASFDEMIKRDKDKGDVLSIEHFGKKFESMGHPVGSSELDGNLTLTIPKSLHESLIIQATKEGITVNQYIIEILGMG